MADLEPVVAELWRERYGTGRPAHLLSVYPSHVYRHLGKAVVQGRTSVEKVSPRIARRRVRDVLEAGGWTRLEELAELADRFAGAANRFFAELPAGRRPGRAGPQAVSTTACTAVGAAYRAATDPDTFAAAAGPGLRAAREHYQDVELRRHERTSALLGVMEFATAYSGYYDALWPSRERDADVEALRLGYLHRPPMRGSRGTDGPRAWRAGTDRSIADRYKHYASKVGARRREQAAELGGLDPDRHMSVRLVGADPGEIARGEVERACAPAGLRYTGHRALLGSVVCGLHVADLEGHGERSVPRPAGRRAGPLVEWCTHARSLPDHVDRGLADAVRLLAESWAHQSSLAQSLVRITAGRMRSLDTGPEPAAAGGSGVVRGPWDWTAQVELGVPRRLWLALLHRELEWDAPLSRPELAVLLPDMFSLHLRDLVTEPIVPPDPADGDAGDAGDAGDVARTRAGLGVLHALGTEGVAALVTDVRDDRTGWRDRWTEAVDAAPEHVRSICMSADQLRAWVLTNLGEVAPDDPGSPDDPIDDGEA